jgi:hypothetical protein
MVLLENRQLWTIHRWCEATRDDLLGHENGVSHYVRQRDERIQDDDEDHGLIIKVIGIDDLIVSIPSRWTDLRHVNHLKTLLTYAGDRVWIPNLAVQVQNELVRGERHDGVPMDASLAA